MTNQPIWLSALLVATSLLAGCQQKPASDESVQQPTADSVQTATSSLFAGTDPATSSTCLDSCIITYPSYRVITKPHTGGMGDHITLINTETDDQQAIVAPGEGGAQYFAGLSGNNVFVDIGTGVVRQIFVYDLARKKSVALLDNVIESPVLRNGQLSYLAQMTPERATQLKLPACTGQQHELSGSYQERMTFDLNTNKLIPSGNYECIR